MNYKLQITKYKLAKQVLAFCFLFFAFCTFLTSCKNKQDTFNIDFQYDYAPIDSGHYVIYDVDSIYYLFNEVQDTDTIHYQIKEEVGDTFYLLNELCYELDLYRRSNSTSPWMYDRKWIVKRTASTFQKTENDVKFIKLVFPPEQDKEWNGNVYASVVDPFNNFSDWNYHYESVGIPLLMNGLNFDSTLTVVEVNDSNAIQKRLRKEVYAKGVGMIYQEWEILNAGEGIVFPNWQTGKISGFRIRMKVAEHN